MIAVYYEALLKSKEDYKIASRLVNILPLAKGDSSRKAQELLLLSHNQILIWSKRYIEKGIEGLKDRLYHHANALKPFLSKHKDKIELFFLPVYSPDLNSIERVWWYMRKKILNNRYIESLSERMTNFWKLFSHYQKPNDFIPKLCNLNYSV